METTSKAEWTDPFVSALGIEIQTTRQALGMSVLASAEASGEVHRVALSRIESGIQTPSIVQIMALAKAFGVDWQDWVRRAELRSDAVDTTSEDIDRAVGKICQRIASFRKSAGLTQAALAKRMSQALSRDVHPLTITRTEGNKRPIPVDELLAIALILDIDPAELLGGSS